MPRIPDSGVGSCWSTVQLPAFIRDSAAKSGPLKVAVRAPKRSLTAYTRRFCPGIWTMLGVWTKFVPAAMSTAVASEAPGRAITWSPSAGVT